MSTYATAITSTIYISGAGVTLSPPGAGPTARTSPSAAMAAISGSGLYSSDLANHSSSGLRFALFTDLGDGPQPSAGKPFRPTYVHHPVWFVDYHGVQWAPSGPAPMPGSVTPTSSALVTSDEFFIVDDLTGRLIEMADTHPSSTAPSPTLVPPAIAKTSSG